MLGEAGGFLYTMFCHGAALPCVGCAELNVERALDTYSQVYGMHARQNTERGAQQLHIPHSTDDDENDNDVDDDNNTTPANSSSSSSVLDRSRGEQCGARELDGGVVWCHSAKRTVIQLIYGSVRDERHACNLQVYHSF